MVSLRIGSCSMGGSKRNVSGSSKPVTILAEESNLKGKKLKALMGSTPNQEKPLLKVRPSFDFFKVFVAIFVIYFDFQSENNYWDFLKV